MELGTASVLLATVFGLLMIKESLASHGQGAHHGLYLTGTGVRPQCHGDHGARPLLGELLHPLGLLFMLVIIAAFVGNTLMAG